MAGSSEQFLLDIRAKFDQLTPAQSALSQIEKQLVKEKAALEGLEKKLLSATPKQAGELLKQVDAQRKNVAMLGKATPAWREFAEQSKKADYSKVFERLFPSLKQFSDASEQGEAAAMLLSGGIGIAAKAAMVLAAAVVVATAAVLGFALYAADAARSNHLLAVAAAGSAIAGTELVAVVSQLARRLPIAREKLDEIAKGLIDAKLAGRDMQNALTAIGIVASARGQQAASAIENIAKQSGALRRFMLGARDVRGEFVALAGTGIKATDVYEAVAKTLGISVAQAQQKVLSGTISMKQGMEILANVAQNKFGGTIAGQMILLTTQIDKAKENLGLLFAGVNIDKFLTGLSTITAMLSQDTYTGYALKTIFSSALTGFFDTASAAFPYVRAFLIGIAISALTVYLTFLRIKKAISEAIGPLNPLKDKVDGIKVAMYAGIGIVGALVGIFIALAVAIGMALLPLIVLGAVIALVIAGALFIGQAFQKGMTYVIAAVVGAWNKLSEVNLWEYGANAIQSLIKGVLSKAGALAIAVATVAGIIPATTATTLDMHSPSKIAFKQGAFYTKGMIGGAESEKDRLEQATAGIAAAAVRGGASGGSMGGAGERFSVKELHFHVPRENMREEVREIVFGLIADTAAET